MAAACAKYSPAPVSPSGELERYNHRSLSDSGLAAWFDSLGQVRPSGPWTARQLAIAAVWLRTEREVRLAQIHAADAAVISAGGRPQPGVSTDLEYAFSDPQASSRWGMALAGLFTIELGGKRGARIGRARAEAMAVRAGAAETEWEQVGQVYSAIAQWAQARQLVVVAREERAGLDSVVRLTEARFEGGTLTRLDLARSTADQRTAIAAEQSAEREEVSARAAVLQAIGLPANSSVDIADLGDQTCAADSREALQQSALERRWSIRRSAAEYQVAEGQLRLEVATAAPDLALGPGIFFDQGTGKFTLGLGFPTLALNRNRGPIGAAEAQRSVAGARLIQAQEVVLSQVDAAMAACGVARQQVSASDSLAREVEARFALVQAAYDRGETGRLEVTMARQELVRSRRFKLDARMRETTAALQLEYVLGAYGTRADGEWPRVTDYH